MNTRTTEVLDYIPLAGISFNELFTLCYWFVETHELHAALGNMNAKGQAHKRRNGKWYPGEQLSPHLNPQGSDFLGDSNGP